MGQVNMESQRHGARSQRNSRGPAPRRRRSGNHIDPNLSRREQREAVQERLSRRRPTDDGGETSRAASPSSPSRPPTRGNEGFVDGAHGTPPSRDHRGRRDGRREPGSGAPDAVGTVGTVGTVTAAGAPRPRGRRSGFRGRVADWWMVWGPHVRRFLPTVLVNHAVTLALVCAVAVIIGVGGSMRAIPAMIGSFWMMVNLAPVSFSGAELGVAPLLPALLILLGHARRVRTACGNRISVRDIRAFGALSMGVPAVVTVIAWLMLWDASHVFDVSPPNILLALLTTVLFNGVVFAIGLGPRIWRALLLRRGLPTWPVESVLLAGRFAAVLVSAGAVAVVVQLLLNIGGVSDAYDIAGGAAGVLGLTLLSLLYLPNLAVGGAAVLLGGEMHVGDASASLFAVTNANLPPLPLLAAMPNGDLRFGPVLLIIPAVLAIGTVYLYLRGRSYVEAPLWTAVGGGVAAAVTGFLLAWAAGGTLGYFGGVGPLLWLTPLLFLGWLLVPTIIVLLWIARAGRRVTETAAEADEADEVDEVDEVDEADEGETEPEDSDGADDSENPGGSDSSEPAEHEAEPEEDEEEKEGEGEAESADGTDAETESETDADTGVETDTGEEPEPDEEPDEDTPEDADPAPDSDTDDSDGRGTQ